MSDVPYQYIVVRKDLDLLRQMIHVGHAAGESVRVAPIPDTTRLVLLHARDEQELSEWFGKAKSWCDARGLRCVMITEPDGPDHGRGCVSFGIEPNTLHSALRKLFHHLPKADLFGTHVLGGLAQAYREQCVGDVESSGEEIESDGTLGPEDPRNAP